MKYSFFAVVIFGRTVVDLKVVLGKELFGGAAGDELGDEGTGAVRGHHHPKALDPTGQLHRQETLAWPKRFLYLRGGEDAGRHRGRGWCRGRLGPEGDAFLGITYDIGLTLSWVTISAPRKHFSVRN